MLSCRELVELVTDYLEGVLPADRQREVHAHLLDCADCLRYLGQIQVTTRLLAHLPSDDLTAEDNEALAAAFRSTCGGDAAPDHGGGTPGGPSA